jgi:hypothetical protein
LRHCAPSKTRGDRRREESRLIGDGHHTGGRHGVESKAKAQSARQADISDAEIHDTVRRLSGEFGRAVPSTLQSIGSYVPRDGDPWWHREYGVPDGSYRVAGADLVLRFEDGWLSEVIVPKPPDYGGATSSWFRAYRAKFEVPAHSCRLAAPVGAARSAIPTDI